MGTYNDFYNYLRHHQDYKHLNEDEYEWYIDRRPRHRCCDNKKQNHDWCNDWKPKFGCCDNRKQNHDPCNNWKLKYGRCNDKKPKTECSGYINTNSVLVDIFPNCQYEGSRIIINVFNTFVATTINTPTCFTNDQETFLLTGGSGVLGFNNSLYQGAYTIILHESPGAFDRFILVFVGRNATGSEIKAAAIGNVLDGQLSIKKCMKGYLGSPFADESLKLLRNNIMGSDTSLKNKITTVVILPNGEVETNEMSI